MFFVQVGRRVYHWKVCCPSHFGTFDQNQCGSAPGSSATFALISMLYNLTKATDGTGNSVRVFLFNYHKAFDLIDHTILVNKICQLPISAFVVNWIIDVLAVWKQRVELAKDCFSGRIPCGVPQETKLGPLLFILIVRVQLLEICWWYESFRNCPKESIQPHSIGSRWTFYMDWSKQIQVSW